MLKYRLLTAAILIPLLVWAILAMPPLYFVTSIMVVFGLSAWEWSKLTGYTSIVFSFFFVAVILLGFVFAQWFYSPVYLLIGLLMWLWAFIAILVYNCNKKTAGFHWQWLRVIAGFVLIVPAMLACMLLRTSATFGPALFLLTLFIVFAADTGGYFAGRFLGKRALVVNVSPKKTWAGFFGGLLLALLVAIIGSFLIPMSMQQRIVLWVLSLLTAAISVVGDLTVSLLKRISGVKDTGNILPGHGGLLDRLDSVLAAVTFFAFFAVMVGY